MTTCNAHDRSVSVIIPAYNAEGWLSHAVDSALSQTHPPGEVIVVDDGSTDATRNLAEGYGDRIRYIQQRNRGPAAARNAGLHAAQSEFIAFLDADDYWRPDFLRTCVEFLSAHVQAIAVSTGLITKMFDGSEVMHPAAFCTNGEMKGEPLVLDSFFDFWARHDHVRTGSNVIRRSVIEQAGPQREDLRNAEDLEYWGYLATFGRWGFIPRPLWVGNSRQAARQHGWLARYETRRKLCPDVEQWGRRIEPRLQPGEREAYARVQGSVAMVYAHDKILAGARESAYELVRKYGSYMPACRMSRIMCAAVHFGPLGWLVACEMIWLKEWAKATRLRLGWQRGMA